MVFRLQKGAICLIQEQSVCFTEREAKRVRLFFLGCAFYFEIYDTDRGRR